MEIILGYIYHKCDINELRQKKRTKYISTYHTYLNPIALGKAKIVCNFGLSECNRVHHKCDINELPQKKGTKYISTYHTYLKLIALRKAKIVCNFGLSECTRIKLYVCFSAILSKGDNSYNF